MPSWFITLHITVWTTIRWRGWRWSAWIARLGWFSSVRSRYTRFFRPYVCYRRLIRMTFCFRIIIACLLLVDSSEVVIPGYTCHSIQSSRARFDAVWKFRSVITMNGMPSLIKILIWLTNGWCNWCKWRFRRMCFILFFGFCHTTAYRN